MVMMMSKDELNLSDILVAKDLSKIRQSKGLSISEISEETGLTRSMISNIERSQNVGLYNIIKYADYLGYDVILKKKKKKKIVDIMYKEN